MMSDNDLLAELLDAHEYHDITRDHIADTFINGRDLLFRTTIGAVLHGISTAEQCITDAEIAYRWNDADGHRMALHVLRAIRDRYVTDQLRENTT